MSLHCPGCKKALRVVLYEGAKVAFCTHCNGFFMSPKALLQIQQARDANIPRDSGARAATHAEVSRLCPKCELTVSRCAGWPGSIKTTSRPFTMKADI